MARLLRSYPAFYGHTRLAPPAVVTPPPVLGRNWQIKMVLVSAAEQRALMKRRAPHTFFIVPRGGPPPVLGPEFKLEVYDLDPEVQRAYRQQRYGAHSFFVKTPPTTPSVAGPTEITIRMVTQATQIVRPQAPRRKPHSHLSPPETAFPTPDQLTLRVLGAASARRSQKHVTKSWLGKELGQLPTWDQQQVQVHLYKTDPRVRRHKPETVLYPPAVINPFVIPLTDDQQHLRVVLVRRPKPRQYTTVLGNPIVVNPPDLFQFQQTIRVVDYASIQARVAMRRRGAHSVLHGPATLVAPVVSAAKYRLLMGVGV